MKAALFSPVAYHGNASPGWPVPADVYSHEAAAHSFNTAIERFRIADEIGFDWVTVAEHHFSPFSLTPNPMLLAGALTQVVKRAKIAVLGPTLPMLNPVRVAEEFAMLDTHDRRPRRRRADARHAQRIRHLQHQSRGIARRGSRKRCNCCAWCGPSRSRSAGRAGTMNSAPSRCGRGRCRSRIRRSSCRARAPSPASSRRRITVGLGFAVTTIPLATKAAAHYREHASKAGWTPTPNDVIYRCAIHVADTDEQAQADMANMPPQRRFSISNPALEQAVAGTSYYGRDAEAQRGRVGRPGAVKDAVENGQIMLGSPETVMKQIGRVRDEIGAGILDLIFMHPVDDKARHAIELFGAKILPRLHDME